MIFQVFGEKITVTEAQEEASKQVWLFKLSIILMILRFLSQLLLIS